MVTIFFGRTISMSWESYLWVSETGEGSIRDSSWLRMVSSMSWRGGSWQSSVD
jgi:hypothetical protein